MPSENSIAAHQNDGEFSAAPSRHFAAKPLGGSAFLTRLFGRKSRPILWRMARRGILAAQSIGSFGPHDDLRTHFVLGGNTRRTRGFSPRHLLSHASQLGAGPCPRFTGTRIAAIFSWPNLPVAAHFFFGQASHLCAGPLSILGTSAGIATIF